MIDDGPKPASGGKHVGVLVVHGVGEVAPGEVMDMLLGALAKEADIAVDPKFEILRLPESFAAQQPANITQASPAAIATAADVPQSFPAQIRTARLADGDRVTFVELFWSDLSHIGAGRLSTLLGLFRVVFEAHKFIDAMLSRHAGPFTRVLRWLLLGLSFTLRGPLAALSVCVLLICWIAVNLRPNGGLPVLGQQHLDFKWLAIVLLGVLAAIALAFMVSTRRRKDRTWQSTLLWLTIAAVGTAVWIVVRGYGVADGQVTGAQWLSAAYAGLVSLWIIWGIAFVVGLAIALAKTVQSAVSHLRGPSAGLAQPPALTAVGIVALQLLLWTAIGGALAMPMIGRAEEIAALTQLKEDAAKSGLTFAKAIEINRVLDIPPFAAEDVTQLARFKFFYGYNGLISIAFITAIVWIVAVRKLVAFACRSNYAKAARLMPRLLFSRSAITILLALAVIQVGIHLVFDHLGLHWEELVAQLRASFVSADFELGLCRLMQRAPGCLQNVVEDYKYAVNVFAALLAVGLPIAFGDRLNNALHIARDLIDHHYSTDPVLFGERPGGREHALPERFPRRARIQRRLHALIDHLTKREHLDGIVFLAHSQGTVIVYDFLQSAAPAYRELNGIVPAVVTCGSPLTHIYRQYFHEYGHLDSELGRLGPALAGWTNLYRLDDYIGTWLGPRSESPIVNEAMPAGGHADYWKETVLVRHVCEAIAKSVNGR